MPHVLWQLQGEREPSSSRSRTRTATRRKVFAGFEAGQPGTMTPLQYDEAVGDLVGYLQWMGEPAQNHARARRRLGADLPGVLTSSPGA
jgi:ubiquinol-cytochrome c reductase cytochrome c1 subunit